MTADEAALVCPRCGAANVLVTSVAVRGEPMPDGSLRDSDGASGCCRRCANIWPLPSRDPTVIARDAVDRFGPMFERLADE